MKTLWEVTIEGNETGTVEVFVAADDLMGAMRQALAKVTDRSTYIEITRRSAPLVDG